MFTLSAISAITQFQNIYAQNLKSFRDYYTRVDNGDAATRSAIE